MSAPLLRLRGVRRTFGGFPAVDGVDLDVHPGQVMGLIGSNGAGKSTLLHLIFGRLAADEGEVVFGGEDVSRLPAFRRARLGMALKFQVTSVFDRLTVAENLLLGALPKDRRPTGDEAERVEQVLEVIAIGDRFRPAGALSHGERQWLEIGMVLLTEPRLLLLDEPTSGMTSAEGERTAALLHRLRDSGRVESMVVVEHDVEFIAMVSDRVTVLHRGRVLAAGTVTEVRNDPAVQDSYLGRLG